MQKRQTKKEKENLLIKERIKQAIQSKNMKLKQFARDSGMAYPSLRDYYSGLRKPGFDAIATLLRFTGVSAEWLLLGVGNMFADEEAMLVNVDEVLMGQITRSIERSELKREAPADEEKVAEGEDEDYLYANAENARKERLSLAGAKGVVVGSVYNRVANIKEPRRRDEAVDREVQILLRVNRSLSQIGGDHSAQNTEVEVEADPKAE